MGEVAGQVPRRQGRRRKRRRVRRTIALVLLVAMVPVGWSYVGALRAPGSAPLSARTVEWIKSHGGRGLVLEAEKLWYSWHTPPIGGTPKGGIPADSASAGQPTLSPAATTPKPPDHLRAPRDIRPFVTHPLPREGVWQTVGKSVEGTPTVRVAYLRADPVHTSLLSGVMWMDTRLLRAVLISGTQSPGGSGWRFGAEVPRSLYGQLAATFNSGFLLQDSNGGFYSEGKSAAPLVPGQASVVIYKDGSITVGGWGTDARMTPDVAAVRQNLSLIVNDGRPVAGLGTDSLNKWGATLGNATLVWRSGVGVTKDGALVYAAGPGLSVQTLADLLARAGCVRAMELDINTEWTSANYYTQGPPASLVPHVLLSDMYRSANRYLVPDERDFFAMLLRRRFAAAGG